MKKFTELMHPDTFYHVYNRGNNSEKLFFEERNYSYFLDKFKKYIPQVADTYAYCLMNNHFHFLIKTKSEEEIKFLQLLQESTLDPSIFICKKFAHSMNGYAQAIYKEQGRTGSLFEKSFRRKVVDNHHYLTQVIKYIHLNPIKANLVKDYEQYKYSSYNAIISDKKSMICKEKTIDLFSSKEAFIKYHKDALMDFQVDWG